jgi:hypothetical protein
MISSIIHHDKNDHKDLGRIYYSEKLKIIYFWQSNITLFHCITPYENMNFCFQKNKLVFKKQMHLSLLSPHLVSISLTLHTSVSLGFKMIFVQ